MKSFCAICHFSLTVLLLSRFLCYILRMTDILLGTALIIFALYVNLCLKCLLVLVNLFLLGLRIYK